MDAKFRNVMLFKRDDMFYSGKGGKHNDLNQDVK